MKKEKKYVTEIQQTTYPSPGRPKINNAKIVKALIPIERICEFKEVVKSFQKCKVQFEKDLILNHNFSEECSHYFAMKSDGSYMPCEFCNKNKNEL
jgi:hypothetical protein